MIGRNAWLALLPLTALIALSLGGAPNAAGTRRPCFVNQHGYLPDGPKRATVVSASAEPLAFEIVDSAGRVAFAGFTTPRGFDASAGLPVHVADFTDP